MKLNPLAPRFAQGPEAVVNALPLHADFVKQYAGASETAWG